MATYSKALNRCGEYLVSSKLQNKANTNLTSAILLSKNKKSPQEMYLNFTVACHNDEMIRFLVLILTK